MSLTTDLDLAIKLAEAKTISGEYTLGGKTYPAYMTNADWKAFVEAMLPTAKHEFGAGSGGEMEEKNGRPPKMASFGSSSRMLYMLSRHKEGFSYEKKLSTTIGGTANLDGFLEEDYRYVFVEAKCHEPYSAKKSVSVSLSYAKLYQYISSQMSGLLDIMMQPSTCGRYMTVNYYAEGEPLEYFD